MVKSLKSLESDLRKKHKRLKKGLKTARAYRARRDIENELRGVDEYLDLLRKDRLR